MNIRPLFNSIVQWQITNVVKIPDNHILTQWNLRIKTTSQQIYLVVSDHLTIKTSLTVVLILRFPCTGVIYNPGYNKGTITCTKYIGGLCGQRITVCRQKIY